MSVNTEQVRHIAKLARIALIDQKLRLRDDVIDDGNVRDKLLANAPDSQHGFFAVPKVIE